MTIDELLARLIETSLAYRRAEVILAAYNLRGAHRDITADDQGEGAEYIDTFYQAQRDWRIAADALRDGAVKQPGPGEIRRERHVHPREHDVRGRSRCLLTT